MLPRPFLLCRRLVGLMSLFLLWTAHKTPLNAAEMMFEAVTVSPALNSVREHDPVAKRSRRVRLAQPFAERGNGGVAPQSNLTVNLFPDRAFDLIVQERRKTEFGGETFQGRLGNNPSGTGVFVVQNGVMSGVVNSPDGVSFKIQYVGNGVHEIVEIDPQKRGQCGAELLTTIPSSEPGGLEKKTDEESRTSTRSPLIKPTKNGDPAAQENEPAIVDIMIVYTDLSMAGAGGKDGIETLAQLAVEEANLCYANSQINMLLNLVNVRKIDYVETGDIVRDVENMQANAIPGLEDLRKIQYKADLVSMITEREDTGTIAGIAYVMRDINAFNRDFAAFSVVRRAFAVGDYTFAHEIGHNLGCEHDRDNAPPPSFGRSFPFSYGQRFIAEGVTYATVMTYPPGVRIPHFSNPNISFTGTPTGVSSNSPVAADNAATINYTGRNVTSEFLIATRRYSLSETSYTGNEGGQVEIVVKRIGTSASGMSIEYATENDSATAGADYEAASGILSFASGETQKSFFVNLLDDNDSELAESFIVRLSTPRPLGSSALGVPESAIVEIIDDESSFSVEQASMSASENVGEAYVVVVRGGATNSSASVEFALTSGSAHAGEDFLADIALVTFLPGENVKSVPLRLLDDLEPEPDEFFNLVLSNPSNGYELVEPAEIAVSILDNDRPGALVPYADESGGVNDIVYAVKARPNGKVLVAGRFSQIAGKQQAGIAQLNSDGTFDSSFDPGVGVNGTILAIDLLPDGRSVIGGDFGSVNGIARVNLAVLNEDGSLSETFDPGSGANSWIRGLAIDAEGRILIGGFFTTYQGIARAYLARVNTDGSLDTGFSANLASTQQGIAPAVRSMAEDANGGIVIGGDFDRIDGHVRQFYGRLLPNGALDFSFNQILGANDRVRAVSIQSDGKILLGGHFTTLDGNQANRIGRLNSNGSYDSAFVTSSGPNNNVHDVVAVQSDGGVVIGGDFSAVGAESRSRIAKLLQNGGIDMGFNPGSGADALVWSVDADSAGRVHLGGEFSKVNGQKRLRVATLRVSVNEELFEPVISPFNEGDISIGQVRLKFFSRPGALYALDYAHDLGGNWTPIVTNFVAGVQAELIDDSPALDRRYYRVREVD